jgi:hypothetical protein
MLRDERKASLSFDDVLDRVDLKELLDRYAVPAATGRRWHCPIASHDDSDASVSMSRDRNGRERWRCWSSGDDPKSGRGHGGDAVDLIVQVDGVSKSEALQHPAGQYGITADRPLPPPRAARPATPVALEMSPVVGRYVDACHAVLRGSTGRKVTDWLHARGITDQTIRLAKLGVDPGYAMMSRAKGLPHGHTMAATFPAFDPHGNVTYVQARNLDTSRSPKYDNPTGALAPNPRLAWTPPLTVDQRRDVLVVCEGIPDALIAAQSGFVSVGLMGASAHDEHVAMRLHHQALETDATIVVVCDPDAAGRSASQRLVELLDDLGASPIVLFPPDGFDITDWALANPNWADELNNSIDGELDYINGPGIAGGDVASIDQLNSAAVDMGGGLDSW